jgi:predicted DNA binding protein
MVGSQRAILNLLRTYGTAGATLALEKIAGAGNGQGALDEGAEGEYEVHKTAYPMGIYGVPRGASTAGVAEALEVDAATG